MSGVEPVEPLPARGPQLPMDGLCSEARLGSAASSEEAAGVVASQSARCPQLPLVGRRETAEGWKANGGPTA